VKTPFDLQWKTCTSEPEGEETERDNFCKEYKMQFLFTGFTEDKGFRALALMRLHEETCAAQRDAAGKGKSRIRLAKPNRSREESSTPLVPMQRRTSESKIDLKKDPLIDPATGTARVVTFWRDWIQKGKLREEAVAQKGAIRKRIRTRP
jgi:hypothetical protein